VCVLADLSVSKPGTSPRWLNRRERHGLKTTKNKNGRASYTSAGESISSWFIMVCCDRLRSGAVCRPSEPSFVRELGNFRPSKRTHVIGPESTFALSRVVCTGG
jgi:hypothetical protein